MRKFWSTLAFTALVTTSVLAVAADRSARSVELAPSTATDPVADPKAMVQAGHARFTVLTPELIRMEFAVDGHF